MRRVAGVDVGGTFTDIVVFDGDTVRSTKTPTTEPQSVGVVSGLVDLVGDEDFEFLHGTTVATNALLEETGARVLLVTSPGFEDVVEIGRQARPSLYDASVDRPRPLVDRELRVGVADTEAIIAAVRRLSPEAVAIGLLDSYSDPSQEMALALAVESAFPDLPVSVAATLSPGFREYERIATAVIDAYLSPKVAGYLRSLDDEVDASSASVMTSSGGLATFDSASRAVGSLTLSGPAAGVVAGDILRRYHGIDSVIAFDMGGTSTDVTRIGPDGVIVSPSQQIGGRVNRVPSMPVHTIGAGGGSMAWCDPGGALRVGPQSAGSHPGPAAYGRGGRDPTVTDANTALGYLPDRGRFTGSLEIDRELAISALQRLGEELSMSAIDIAIGVIEVADAHIERALRRVSVEEGFDPRDSSLLAFGGAGGLHATRVARRLGMQSVIIPPHTGVFSALGLLLSRPRVERLKTVLATATSPGLVRDGADVVDGATRRFIELYGVTPDAVDITVDARYVSQSHELTVDYRSGHVADDFVAEHRSRFGFQLDDHDVEVVNIRAVAVGSAPLTWDQLPSSRPTSSEDAADAPMWVDSGVADTPVVNRASLGGGSRLQGPALVVDHTATTLLGMGENLVVLEDGTLQITW